MARVLRSVEPIQRTEGTDACVTDSFAPLRGVNQGSLEPTTTLSFRPHIEWRSEQKIDKDNH